MSQKKILVVDDDPDVRLGLQVRLNANHYDVVCAGDGVTSISQARKQMPDLMILDLGLPAGDGFSVLERMKANELSSIPVIVLSGQDRVSNRNRAIEAGAKTSSHHAPEHRGRSNLQREGSFVRTFKHCPLPAVLRTHSQPSEPLCGIGPGTGPSTLHQHSTSPACACPKVKPSVSNSQLCVSGPLRT